MEDNFTGFKVRKIDAKGRISINSELRPLLGKEFIASFGVSKCLALYPVDEWDAFLKKLEKVPYKERKKLEFRFNANAERMSLDGQGRILLNENKRMRVDLGGESEAVVFGNGKRIEIWNCDAFNAEYNSTPDDMEDAFEKWDL